MLRRVLFSVLLPAAFFFVRAQEFVSIAPEDILFLAHFNSDLRPELGRHEGMTINQALITGGGSGYGFNDSVPRAEALDVCRDGKYLAFPAEGNFEGGRGTLQLFIKPQWRASGYNHCVFFKLVFNRERRDTLEWSGANSFVLQKPAKLERLQFFQNGNNSDGAIYHDIPLGQEAWYQLALTWDADKGESRLYVNGAPAGSAKFMKMTALPAEFTLGAPRTFNAQSLIDEVRILRRVLSAAEIRQDYAALSSGRQFPRPKAAPLSQPPRYVPQPPEMREEGFAASLAGVEFVAPLIDRELKLDGELSEPEWSQTAAVPDLRLRNENLPIAKTDVRLLHSPGGIYIGAIMHEPEMESLVALYDQRDLQIYNDDCLEIMLDCGGGTDNFYHIAVNALGSIYDAKNSDRRWNGKGIKTSTSRHEDHWIIEMFIPYSDLQLPQPQVGEFWGLRLCRERHHAVKELSTVPVVKQGSFSQRTFLGRLNFQASGKGADARLALAQDDFQMGCNMLAVLVSGKLPDGELSLQAMLFDDNNFRLETQQLRLPGTDGEKLELAFPVVVSNDRCSRIIVALKDAAGGTLTSAMLKRGFSNTSPGIQRMRQELQSLRASMLKLDSSQHPLHQGARQSLEQIEAQLGAYEQNLQQAVRQKNIVAKADTETLAAHLCGFRRFMDDYRYLVWQTSPWEVGRPDALPPLDHRPGKLNLSFQQAGNEREALCLVISGLLCGPRLDLRLVPQSSLVSGKPFLSCDQFEIYTEPFVDHNGDTITAPLIRAPGNIITLTPGESLRVWVVFNSRSVAAGEYFSSLQIKPLRDYDIPNREIPVSVKVWNFTLPETRDWPLDCYFWTGQMTPLDETALLRLMHQYHVKWTMTESHNYKNGFINDRRWINPRPKEGLNYDVQRALHANQEFFDEAARLRMKIIFSWGTNDDVSWHELMTQRLYDMGFGNEDFIFHGALRDEFSLKDIPRAAELRGQLKAASKGWNFMATYLSTPPPSGASLEDLENNELTDFFQVWSVISHRLFNERNGQEAIDFFRKHQRTLWAYRCNTNMQTIPVLSYYRFFPWLGFKHKLDGIAFWSAYSSKGDDGFDHRDGYDDGITWRGIDKQPVSTKRLEALREGLEDVAYMHMLQQAVERAEQENPQLDLSQTKAMYGERMHAIIKMESQDEVDRWRIEVGETIDRLTQDKKPSGEGK